MKHVVRRPRVRFDRNELAGAFGDIGTDLPLLLAMIPAAGLDPATAFLLFGLAQVATGWVYGLPMPMQPLKAMAVIVIAGQIPADVLFGGGFVVGAAMLLLAGSGGLEWLARVIPRAVVRGIQLGLALSLGHLALSRYVPSEGASGYVLAAISFAIMVALLGNRRLPPALPVIGLGVIVACFSRLDAGALTAGMGWHVPTPRLPTASDMATGLVVLALPQLPLSLSNSIFATERTLRDLYPERSVGVRKLGITYGLANLALPLFGGVPVCHGCGGLAGHHAFGGRTGGSVVIYGGLFVAAGLLLGGAAAEVVRLFPHPVLGVVLLFEAGALAWLTRDVAGSRLDLTIALLVAVSALTLPQGYVVGLVVGTALHHGWRMRPGGRDRSPPHG